MSRYAERGRHETVKHVRHESCFLYLYQNGKRVNSIARTWDDISRLLTKSVNEEAGVENNVQIRGKG